MKHYKFFCLSWCILVSAFLTGCGGGGSSSTSTTTTQSAPTVTSISPTSVIAGSGQLTLTVNGTGFLTTTTVQVGGVSDATAYVNSTQVTATVTPQQLEGGATLSVIVMNGTTSSGSAAAINLQVNNPVPVISSLAPSTMLVGATSLTITVTGTGFVPATVIDVNGSARTTTYVSGTQVSVALTAGDVAAASSLSLTAVNATPGGGTSAAAPLTVNNPVSNTNPTAPALTSISPNAGPINTPSTVTLTGTGFTDSSTVAMNGTNVAAVVISATELTVDIPASSVALPGNVNFTVTTPGSSGGTTASLPYTAYIAIPNNAMALNPVNGLLYVSVPSSAGAPYGNSVVPVDPETGAIGTPIAVGSEPDQLAISSDGTTLWVGLDGASAVREVNLTTGVPGMQFSFGDNGGIYAYPSLVHAIAVLPGSPNSIVVSSALNQYTYEDMLVIYDSGAARANTVDLSTLSSLPAIFVSPTKAEVYATSFYSGYQVLSYNSSGLQNLAGNTGTENFSAVYGTAVQVDNGVAYLDSGVALNAETGALLGTFYSSGTTVATGPMVSDSSLGKLFILENTSSYGSSAAASIQAFNESDFTPSSSSTLQVNGAVSGSRYGAGNSSATELNGNNPINTMVRWGADGLAFRAANGVFSFRTSIVQDLSTVNADLGVTIVSSGSAATGANTTYTATIENSGPSASTNIALTAIAPSTGILVSATPSSGSCSTATAVSCNLGGLSSGASVTVTFVVSQQTTGASTLSLQVKGSENDPNLTNNQASSTVTITGSDYSPAPTIVSVVPAAILAGSSDTEITVTGTGFTSASSILIGGTPLSTSEVSSTQLTATVPAANLTTLGWTTVSVSTPAPGGGNTATLPLSIFNVISLDANHILYDPYSRKIMASVASDSTSVTGNSLVAITPETSTVGTPVAIGSQPTNMALTPDGQILYTILAGSQSVALFNMLTQTADFTYVIQPGTGTDTSPAPRGIAIQPGTEDTAAIDLGSWAGNAIYAFDLTNKTAAMVGQASGPYSGSCLAFLDAGDMLAFDTDTSGATLDHYTVTSAGFTYYNYSQYTESTLNGFGCFKLSGGLAFGNAGGIANPATVPATQIGLFPVSGGGEFSTSSAFVPDTSLQTAFYLANTQSGSSTGDTLLDGIESFNQNTFLPTSSVSLDMQSIEGNTTYTGVDMVRWGQDGLAVLTSGGHIYLLRGAFVVPQLLGTNSAASLTSSSTTSITHGTGNTLLTLTGANFVPGVAVTWNGKYRTTTIVNATQVTVAIPSSDLSSAGSATLMATNPGAKGSNTLTVTIN